MKFLRHARELALKLWTRLYYGRLAAPNASEDKLIAAIRAELSAIAPIENGHSTECERMWSRFQETLRHSFLNRDPREFLTWDVMTRTMFLAFSAYAAKEFFHLQRLPNWSSRWKAAIRESTVGRPAPFPFYPPTSANLVHEAYTLSAFEDATGMRVSDFAQVLEFGGGYGSMCRLFFNLGFGGIYKIYDLGPFSSVQSYFLKSLNIPVKRASTDTSLRHGVELLSNERQLAAVGPPPRGGKSLFLAAWSLSETPLTVRHRILPHVQKHDAYLIAYQDRFGEADNREFFEEWQRETASQINWRRVRIAQIPGSHWYLFGKKLAKNLDSAELRQEVGAF
jgi:hypothetical protein